MYFHLENFTFNILGAIIVLGIKYIEFWNWFYNLQCTQYLIGTGFKQN